MTDQATSVEDSTSEGERMQVLVRSTDGNEVSFRIKSTSRMEKLMNAYCDRLGVAHDSLRFLYDGKRIKGVATAEELGLEHGDTINAMIQQVGS
ncbi:ubiquitin-like protein [Streptomyces sp. NPDC005918]|uniref:ubiquitin-like protein n=1 Tax=Streptomyces sp. NPDC005918 TaxID=3155454 RepID=UPI0033FA791E